MESNTQLQPPHAGEPLVNVTTTYLQILSWAHFCPAFVADPDVQIIQAFNATAGFYRFLYASVGRDYHWIDRLTWSDEQLEAYLARPNITLLVLYVRGVPAGYIELDSASSEPGTEVAYFGLIDTFHGRGLGKYLLSAGVQHAFDDGAQRVWVHTCTLDGPHALANYQARGFSTYRTVTHEQTLSMRQAA
jgi:ribosomal protein S18 acetylase RimI-like enzyme